MSFDLIVLKPTDPTASELSEVESVSPLGTTASVSLAFDKAFPGCSERPFIFGEEFAVELALSGEPVESAHVALRFGTSWNERSEVQFHKLLSQVCLSLGGTAFAVSDNTKVVP